MRSVVVHPWMVVWVVVLGVTVGRAERQVAVGLKQE